jgi:hypothetical protein
MIKIIPNQHKNSLKMALLLIGFIIINISCAYSSGSLINEEDSVSMSKKLQLEISLDKQYYTVEEPIIVKGSIINLNDCAISLKPLLFMDIMIYLKYENNNETVPFGPKVLLNELLQKEDIIKLNPEETFSFVRTIDKKMYVTPKKIGRYELYIIYRNGLKDLGNIELWVGETKSNTVMFEIKE